MALASVVRGLCLMFAGFITSYALLYVVGAANLAVYYLIKVMDVPVGSTFDNFGTVSMLLNFFNMCCLFPAALGVILFVKSIFATESQGV